MCKLIKYEVVTIRNFPDQLLGLTKQNDTCSSALRLIIAHINKREVYYYLYATKLCCSPWQPVVGVPVCTDTLLYIIHREHDEIFASPALFPFSHVFIKHVTGRPLLSWFGRSASGHCRGVRHWSREGTWRDAVTGGEDGVNSVWKFWLESAEYVPFQQ